MVGDFILRTIGVCRSHHWCLASAPLVRTNSTMWN